MTFSGLLVGKGFDLIITKEDFFIGSFTRQSTKVFFFFIILFFVITVFEFIFGTVRIKVVFTSKKFRRFSGKKSCGQDPNPTLFKNYLKCRIWIPWFSAILANFCPIKIGLSGNTVWPHISNFQKGSFFDIFNELLSSNNVNEACFVFNV